MSGLQSVLVLVPMLLMQFGLHMALLNAPMNFMDCKGVEGNGLDCIKGWNAAAASSAYALGGLFGSITAGGIAAYRSHKLKTHFYVYQLATVLFGIGSVILALAQTQAIIVVSRLILGVGAGLSVNCCPIILNRMSPPHRRGMCGSLSQISINVGIIVAQFLGLMWATETSWRRIMYASTVIGVANVILLFLMTKPTEIAEYSREAERLANEIVEELTTGTPQGNEQIETEDTPAIGLKTFAQYPKYRTSLITTITLFFVQQMTGINTIIQYGVWILMMTIPDHAKIVNVAVSFINLLMTVVSAGLVDRCGRKVLLLVSLFLTSLSTAVLAFGLVRGMTGFSIFAVISTVSSFGIGIGPIPFLYISDISPPEAVGIAQSVGTAVSWISTFLVLGFFPTLQNKLGPSSFYLFSTITLACAIFYTFYLPRG